MSDLAPKEQPVDLQDPLPESNWFWRRVFTFLATASIIVLMFFLGYALNRLTNGVVNRIDNMTAETVAKIAVAALESITTMFRLMFWALIIVVTYYMVAPSAEQITKMVKTAALLKGGIQIAGRQTVRTPEAETETAKTVGRPPAPPIPGRGEAKGPPVARHTGEDSDGPPWAGNQE